MNIKDLPTDSYTPLNINSLPQGSYRPITASPTASTDSEAPSVIQDVGMAVGKTALAVAKGVSNFAVGPIVRAGARTGQLIGYGAFKGVAKLTGNEDLSQRADAALATPTTVPGIGTEVPGIRPDASGVKTVAGEAATAALTLAPIGRVSNAARAGLSSLPVVSRFARPLATVGTGALTGYAFDKAAQLEQGETPTAAPGFGTFIGAAIPGAAEAIGASRRLLYPKGVEENAQRALGVVGRVTLGKAAGQTNVPAGKALSILNEMAPTITVKDAAGVDKAFVPSEATYQELPQALYQAKNLIYDAYSKLAARAGDEGAAFKQQDFNAIKTALQKYSGRGYTGAYSAKAQQIVDAIDRYGQRNPANPADPTIYFTKTDPTDIQKLIESINKDVDPISQKAGAEVANDASTLLRELLDKKIQTATGKEYQALRSQYAALKSIEPQVIAQWRRAANRNPLIKPIFEGIGTVDFLQGVITGSPASTVRGLGFQAVGQGLNYLRDKERNLQEAFRLLNGEEPGKNLGQKVINLYPGNILGPVRKQ